MSVDAQHAGALSRRAAAAAPRSKRGRHECADAALSSASAAIGFVVQIAVLAVLTAWLHWPVRSRPPSPSKRPILTNFFWHERWTWRDRAVHGARAPAAAALSSRQRRRHRSSATSRHDRPACASWTESRSSPMRSPSRSLASINFVAADRWVFAARRGSGTFALLHRIAAPACGGRAATGDAGRVESIHRQRRSRRCRRTSTMRRSANRTAARSPCPGGHDPRMARLDRRPRTRPSARLVDALTNPGTPPPQDDVLESRVLDRHGDSLRVYLKLSRRAIVTVTYDTEHDVRFVRRSPTLATSRSVATRIVEVGGERSRISVAAEFVLAVPAGRRLGAWWMCCRCRSAATCRRWSGRWRGPIVNRVARESMVRTLDAVKRFAEAAPDRRVRQRRPSASTVTPAASQAARRRAAMRSAPGRVAVDADRVDPHRDAGTVDGSTTAVGHHAYRASHDRRLNRGEPRPASGSRSQRPVRLVRAVGEALGGHPQSGSAAGVEQLASRAAPNRIKLPDRTRRSPERSLGQRAIARRHVVERAVRLDVLQRARLRRPRRPPRPRSDRGRSPRPRAASRVISRRPKPARSGKPGCAPTATPCALASANRRRGARSDRRRETRRRRWPR